MESSRKGFLGVRHFQAVVMFLCMAVNYLMRINVSIAIVMMTDTESESGEKVFNWSSVQQSTILSAFHIGYFFMNFTAAILVTKFHNKTLLLISVTSSTVLTLLTPVLSRIGGFYAFLIIRISLGLLQGLIMAVMMGQLSRWIPPDERSRCGSLVLGGINFGTMISYAVSGWMGDTFGWPSIFYFSGCTGAGWAILWFVVGADTPKDCWFISEDEKIYIEKKLIVTSEVSKDKKIPYKDLFTNTACWALLLTQVGHNWGNWTLLNEIPSYFKSILHLSSTMNGLMSALPHLCLWLFSYVSSYVSDLLIAKKILSVGACRKLCNSIAHWGAAVSLIVLSYSVNELSVLFVYTVGVTLLGFTYIGYNINHLDIVPEYSGFFMGITNGMGTITSFLGTEFAGVVVTDKTNDNQWRTVFLVSAGVFFVSNLIFVLLGSGKLQPIGRVKTKDTLQENTGDDSTSTAPQSSL